MTVTVDDGNGNQTECAVTILLVDDEDPTIACPADVTINTLSSDCSALHYWTQPTDVGDNCASDESLLSTRVLEAVDEQGNIVPVVPIGPTAFANFPLGVTTVTYTVTDECGNTGTCSFTVTVVDLIPPKFVNCPTTASVSLTYQAGQCGAIASWTPPTYSDNCFCLGVISNYNPGSFFPVGTTKVTYQIQDVNGNWAVPCSFDVVVEDVEDPTIACNVSEVAADLDEPCMYFGTGCNSRSDSRR